MQSSLFATLASLLALLTNAGYALPDDQEQPIQIQADHAQLQEGTGVVIYTGAVRMDQGSLKVTAHRMTIHTADERVVRVDAEGGDQRAHYQQLPTVDGPLIEADADRITYFVDDRRVELQGKAELTRAPEYFASGVIHYNMNTGHVQASGGRVRTTLSPGTAASP